MTAPRHVSPHGTRSRYAHGCRCRDCREASRLYHKRLREGRLTPAMVDSTGTARKLQALHAAGWSFADLAERIGRTKRWPSMLARQESPTVTAATFRIVDRLWRQLRDEPGTSVRARSWARKYGWHGPDAWSDESVEDPFAEPFGHIPPAFVDSVAVESALKGRPVPLTRLERHHAVHAGRERDWSYTRIAEALRMSVSRAKELGARPLPEDCEVAA